MSDRPESENPRHTPDRNMEAAVRDSFPASDSPSATATQGVRAVPPESMAERGPLPDGDTVPIEHAFADAEAAKMALEALVREGPLDRRRGEIRTDPGRGAVLVLRVSPADRERLEGLLRREAHETGPQR